MSNTVLRTLYILLLTSSFIYNGQKINAEIHTTTSTIDIEPDYFHNNEDSHYSNETAIQLKLETALENINLTKAAEYYVDLEEDASTLVISLAQGIEGEPLGDPDIYVRYERHATTKEYDCISFSGENDNEHCIIDEPEEGRYYIYIDAFEGAAVTDATLWASTELFTGNIECEDGAVIRGQSMDEDELESACEIVENTRDLFFNVFKTISPASIDPVSNDLNKKTDINILSSVSNGINWAEYLTSGDNSSGIFYEVSPDKYYHSATIWTFIPLEWTDGRTVYRSLAHEYIHALDGRYNKEGSYKKETGWWSEGLGEYLGTFYNEPYERFEISTSTTQYSLAEIFDQHNHDGVPSPYDWGQLAVAFFMEEHPQETANMISYMRAGQWEDWKALLNTWATTYQDDFAKWVSSIPRQQFENSAKSLELGEYQQVEGRGGWLYAVNVPEDASSLTIKTTGGSGNINLMVSAGKVPHWSFKQKPDCSSQEKDNEETCTFTQIIPGTYYITLDSEWSGADIVDLYLTACTGTQCSVETPSQKPIKAIAEPLLPGTSLEKTFQSCHLVESYQRNNSLYTNVSITNTTSEPIKLHWVHNTESRIYFEKTYATIAPNETYSAKNFWSVKDHIAITDKNDRCLAVGIISRKENHFNYNGSSPSKKIIIPE